MHIKDLDTEILYKNYKSKPITHRIFLLVLQDIYF